MIVKPKTQNKNDIDCSVYSKKFDNAGKKVFCIEIPKSKQN